MANENKKQFRTEKRDRFWTGAALIVVGGFLLADKMGAGFPHWLFTWPMIVVVVGLVSGLKCGFKNFSWLIIVAVGLFFLSDEVFTGIDVEQYMWPVLIIGFGLIFILRPKKKWHVEKDSWKDSGHFNEAGEYGTSSPEDVIDSVSVFGGVKKVITSKQFRGGEIVCFMGGAEYNLSQADINGHVSLEIVQVFGATKLIVPPHWDVLMESVSIFAGIEDKRLAQPGAFDPSKVLILKGTTLFGGIEIRSY